LERIVFENDLKMTLDDEGATMEDDNKLSYFFLGLGLGVVAGVLFAPKSGAETRDFLVSKANEGAELAKRRAEEMREAALETYERGVNTVQRTKENLASAVEAGRQTYREATSNPTAE
jgi:gas vesicle protein